MLRMGPPEFVEGLPPFDKSSGGRGVQNDAEECFMTRSTSAVPSPSADLVDELVVGNRIIFDQKVVDAFGHISVRHDKDPTKYLMARHLAPGLVTAADITIFDLDSNPVADNSSRYYSERFIHAY